MKSLKKLSSMIHLAYCLLVLRRCEVRQENSYDCGPAALVSLAAFYRAAPELGCVRKKVCSGTSGARLSSLADYLEQLGFETEGVRAEVVNAEDLDVLSAVPLPAIAATENDGISHYLTVFRLCGSSVIVMDPAEGVFKRIRRKDFLEIWTGVLLLAVPDRLQPESPPEETEAGSADPSLFSRFLEMVGPYRWTVFGSFAGAVIYTLLGILQSVYIQKTVDDVLPEGNVNLANLLGTGMLLAVSISIVISLVKSRMVAGVGMKIDLKLMLDFYSALLRLPESSLKGIRSGDLLSRMGEMVKVRVFFSQVLLSAAVNVTVVVFSILLMFSYYWKLGLILFISVPLYILIFMVHSRLNAIAQRRVVESSALLESEVLNTIRTKREIRQFALSTAMLKKVRSRMVVMMRSLYGSFLNHLSQGLLTESVSRGFTVAILWSGTVFVIDGEMSPGELLSFQALIAYFISPVSALIGMNASYQEAGIALTRYEEVLEQAEREDPGAISIAPADFEGIRFQEVSFSYADRPLLFHRLNLSVSPGTHVAFVGRSGCGKSSLVLLLQRLYRVSEGKITIAGIDIDSLQDSCLRRNISAVSQGASLFDDDFIANIAVGEEHPDMKRVIQLCVRLELYDYILSLPRAFLTRLGENGNLLSGGQRQRVALARAFYKRSRILILDEATSSIDPGMEEIVKEMIREYVREGNTVISVAHRLKMVEEADRIYVLEKGRIVEQGNHEELLKLKGIYASMLLPG